MKIEKDNQDTLLEKIPRDLAKAYAETDAEHGRHPGRESGEYTSYYGATQQRKAGNGDRYNHVDFEAAQYTELTKDEAKQYAQSHDPRLRIIIPDEYGKNKAIRLDSNGHPMERFWVSPDYEGKGGRVEDSTKLSWRQAWERGVKYYLAVEPSVDSDLIASRGNNAGYFGTQSLSKAINEKNKQFNDLINGDKTLPSNRIEYYSIDELKRIADSIKHSEHAHDPVRTMSSELKAELFPFKVGYTWYSTTAEDYINSRIRDRYNSLYPSDVAARIQSNEISSPAQSRRFLKFSSLTKDMNHMSNERNGYLVPQRLRTAYMYLISIRNELDNFSFSKEQEIDDAVKKNTRQIKDIDDIRTNRQNSRMALEKQRNYQRQLQNLFNLQEQVDELLAQIETTKFNLGTAEQSLTDAGIDEMQRQLANEASDLKREIDAKKLELEQGLKGIKDDSRNKIKSIMRGYQS